MNIRGYIFQTASVAGSSGNVRRSFVRNTVAAAGFWLGISPGVGHANSVEVSRIRDAAGGILGSANYQSVVSVGQGQPASVNGGERLINKAGFICTLDFLDAYRFGSVAATCDAGGGGVEGANGVR